MNRNIARSTTTVLVLLALAGCSGGGGDDTLPPQTNQAPSISGTPTVTVDEGQAYSFEPDATDPDDDVLTFTVDNAPAWANFDTTTGLLSGTPTRADVGVYDDITLSVSDGQTSAALSTFSIEVVQVWNLALSGIATDAPIANASVVVAAGDNEFTASADASGRFSVPVRLRDGDFDETAVMTIRALGVDTQAHVELITQVGGLASLIRQAGEAEVLDSTQNDRLNVTHVSTARYLLASDNNQGQPPADDALLGVAEAAINTDLLLQTAGLIKLIADQGVIAVPEGETTLSLLQSADTDTSNQSHIDGLLVANGLTNAAGEPDAAFQADLDSAIAATLADTTISTGLSPNMLIGTTIWSVAAPPERVANHSSVIEFSADGTGVSYENELSLRSGDGAIDLADVPESFTWTIQNGTLELDFADFSDESFRFFTPPYEELVDTYGFDQSVADFLTQAANDGQIVDPQIRMESSTNSREVSLISAGSGRAHVRVRTRKQHSIDDVLVSLGWAGALPRGLEEQDSCRVFYTSDSLTRGPFPDAASGDQWVLPVWQQPRDARIVAPTAERFVPDLFTLEASGATSTGLLSQQSFQWTAAADGIVLENANERYVYTPLETDGYVYLGLITYSVNGNVRLRSAEWIARGDGSGPTLAADLVQPLPLYWQAGINLQIAAFYRADGRLDPTHVFGYSFNADGSATRIYGPFVPDCVNDPIEPCFYKEGNLWTYSTSGARIVRDTMTSFARSRTWEVLSYAPGGRGVVLEWEVSRFGTEPWSYFVWPRLNTLEMFDLSQWPEEYAASDGL